MHAEHAGGLGVVRRPRATRLISAIACRNSATAELPPGRFEIVGASHPTVGSSTPKDLFYLRVLCESAFHLRKSLPLRCCRQPVMEMLTDCGWIRRANLGHQAGTKRSEPPRSGIGGLRMFRAKQPKYRR